MMNYYIDKGQALVLLNENKEVVFKSVNITFKLKHLKKGYRVSVYNATLEEVFQHKLGEKVINVIYDNFETAYKFMHDNWFKLQELRDKKLSEYF